MNKIRRKKCRRSTQLSQHNQKKFSYLGLSIYECKLQEDYCWYDEEHDIRVPKWEMIATFNMDESESIHYIEQCCDHGKYESIHLVEQWSPKQIRNGLDGMYPRGLSWTQTAIARCDFLE